MVRIASKSESRFCCKVLAINSSPRTGADSKTEVMLDSLLQGMRSAGAEVELVNLKDKKVRHCVGCFTCWTKNPGVCVHKDDMTNELFGAWRDADVVVYATPLYHYTVNARLKTFIERTLPYLEPFMVRKDGYSFHPHRFAPPATVLLSVAGFPDREVFDLLSSWSRFIFGKSLLAEIYRPGAESLTRAAFKYVRQDILEATAQAGAELVNQRKVNPETMERITQEFCDKEDIAAMANIFWRTVIAAGVSPRQFDSKGMTPAAANVAELGTVLRHGFHPELAGELEANIQMELSGEGGGDLALKIAGGELKPSLEKIAEPDLTISAPLELWRDIMLGKVDGQEAFMSGQAQAAGDLGLLMRFQSLFKA